MHQVLNELQKAELKKVYHFYGESTFLITEMISLVKKRVLPQFSNLNYFSFNAGHDTLGAMQEGVATVGFFGNKLIIIHEAERLKTDFLETLMKRLSTNSYLIFISKNRLKSKTLVEGSYPCQLPYEREMSFWIQYLFKKENKNIDREGCEFLISLFGRDLDSLAQEVCKINSYVGGREAVTIEDVLFVCTRGREQTLFTLLNGLGIEKFSKNLFLVYQLKVIGEVPLLIFSMLVKQCRKLLGFKILQEENMPESQMISKLGINPFQIRFLKDQGRFLKIQQLERALFELGTIDYHLKKGQISGWHALERAIFLFQGANEERNA